MDFPNVFVCGWRVREDQGRIASVEAISSPSPHHLVTQALGQLGLGMSDLFAEHNEILVECPIGAASETLVQFPDSLTRLPDEILEQIAHVALVGSHDLFVAVKYLNIIRTMLNQLMESYILASGINGHSLIDHTPNVEVVSRHADYAQRARKNRNVMKVRAGVDLIQKNGQPSFRVWGFHRSFPLMTWAHQQAKPLATHLLIERALNIRMSPGSDAVN